MQADTVIEARWLIPVVPKNTVLEHMSIVITGSVISDILPTAQARLRYQPDKTVTLPESVVMPGLVNLHSHAAMNIIRGLGADLPLMDWLNTKIWPAEGRLMSADYVREGSLLAGREMAMSGVTCTSDQYFFPESAAEGLREAGLRCAVSGLVIGFPSAWGSGDEEYLAKSEALIRNHENDPFVHATIAPHAPYTVSDASLRRCADISERFGVPIHIHVNETAGEIEGSLKTYGLRPIERLAGLGLVNDRLIAVHSVHADASDINRMAAAGSSMCHCPSSNLKLASGFAPLAAFMKAGVNVGIGTDGAASNDKLDMLGETRLAAMLAKAVAGDSTAAKVFDMLEAATLGGARALHWDKEIGSVETGKQADLIAVDLSGVECLPVRDPAAQLLYSAGRENVTHTWVAGQLIAEKNLSIRCPAEKYGFSLNSVAKKWQNML